MDLFDSAGTDDAGLPLDARAPLAVRMRPRSLDEVLGQDHLLAPGSPLRRLVEPADEARGRGRLFCTSAGADAQAPAQFSLLRGLY